MEKAEIAPVGEFRLLAYKKFPDGCRSRNAGLDPPTTKKGEPVTRVSAPLEPMLNTEISFELKSATKRNFPPASVTNPRGPLASSGRVEPVTSGYVRHILRACREEGRPQVFSLSSDWNLCS